MIFSFDLLFCTDLVYCFGHFLWQATLIGAIYFIALGFISQSRPETRYRLGVFCLLGLACCVPITFLMQHDRSMVQSTPSTIGEQLSVEAAIKGGEINGGDALPPTLGSASEILSSHDGGKANSTSRAQAFEPSRAPDANTGWFIDSISPWLVAVYWCCVSLLLLRLMIGVRAAHGYRRTSAPVTDNSLLELFQQAMQRVGISIAPPLRLCSQLLVPCVVGTFRPVIYLPVACTTGLSPDQIEQILVHELAHIKRFDPLVNLFQNVVETLLFFHPVVWLVSRQVRLEREHCCDRFVLTPGNSSGDYAKTLIEVATFGKSGRQSAVALASAGNSRSELQQRIDRILGIGHTRPTRWVEAGSATLIATVLVACLLMATQQNVVAQQSTEENTNQETSAQAEAAAREAIVNAVKQIAEGPSYASSVSGGGTITGDDPVYQEQHFLVSREDFLQGGGQSMDGTSLLWDVFQDYKAFILSHVDVQQLPDMIAEGGSNKFDGNATRNDYTFVSKGVTIGFFAAWFRGGPKEPDSDLEEIQISVRIRVN